VTSRPRIEARAAAFLLVLATAPAPGAATPSPPAAQAGCTVGRYHILALPLLPVAINDRGQVLGTTADARSATWERRSGLHELPLPAGFAHSEGVSINARGHVVALAFDSGFTRSQGFFVAGASMALLGGEPARPRHLNDHDIVVGEARLAGRARSEPVLWTAGTVPPAGSSSAVLEPRPLGACCGGSANGIDDRGLVMGDTYDEQGRYYAFSWSEQGGLQRIDPGDAFSTAVAVNRLGTGVIQAFPQILLYSAASLTRVPLAPRPPAHAHALNDCVVIVGDFGPFANKARAFAWDRVGGLADLNERIPEHSGWKLKSATGINNHGEIVGRGDPPGGLDAGFLLLPATDAAH